MQQWQAEVLVMKAELFFNWIDAVDSVSFFTNDKPKWKQRVSFMNNAN